MKIKSKGILFIGVFLMFFSFSELCHALQPKLLWKKEFKERISSVAFAKESGDVIFVHGDKKNRITLIDKEGNIRWQWGPDLERTITHISVSEDGNNFVFDSSYELWVSIKKGYESKDYIHYFERKGELWKKEDFGTSFISPDGKFVIVGTPAGYEGNITKCYDSKGSLIWKKELRNIGQEIIFSPEKRYFHDGLYLVETATGNVIIEKNFGGAVTSLSENGEYIGVEGIGREVEIRGEGGKIIVKGVDGGVFDKRGDLVIEGKAMISGNGRIAVIYRADGIKVYKLPERVIIKEHLFGEKIAKIDISYNGNIIFIFSEEEKTSIINLETNEIFEGKIQDGLPSIINDGKFLLIEKYFKNRESAAFFLYQIF